MPHPFLCAYVPRLALGKGSWLDMTEAYFALGHSRCATTTLKVNPGTVEEDYSLYCTGSGALYVGTK